MMRSCFLFSAFPFGCKLFLTPPSRSQCQQPTLSFGTASEAEGRQPKISAVCRPVTFSQPLACPIPRYPSWLRPGTSQSSPHRGPQVRVWEPRSGSCKHGNSSRPFSCPLTHLRRSITGSLDYRSSKTGIFCGRKHEQLRRLSHGCQLACIYDSRARILSSIVVGAEKETLGLARLACALFAACMYSASYSMWRSQDVTAERRAMSFESETKPEQSHQMPDLGSIQETNFCYLTKATCCSSAYRRLMNCRSDRAPNLCIPCLCSRGLFTLLCVAQPAIILSTDPLFPVFPATCALSRIEYSIISPEKWAADPDASICAVYALASRTRGAGSPVLDGPGSLSHHASETPSSSGECHLRALSANGSMSTHSLSVRPTQGLSIRSFQRDWPCGLLAVLQIQQAAPSYFPHGKCTVAYPSFHPDRNASSTQGQHSLAPAVPELKEASWVMGCGISRVFFVGHSQPIHTLSPHPSSRCCNTT
ncbi:hypothetical protein QBC46DRAFT_407470 [Diplogelasinospora grovesii]|uniref:Uncharacterized protein n=1 Tax=Diplogelasinospora grovesii TaxID=303347 RepID=A0AAN6N9M9_9PEZI|nr:hypothetical protein QBC46DRAFT_407470 [Diplogelasinospora grovesii]